MRVLACMIVAAGFLAACSDPTNTVASLQKENRELSAEVTALRADVSELKSQMEATGQAVFTLLNSTGAEAAFLELSGGYGTAKTHLGTSFFVAWDDSKPQGDGTQVALRIGNPYTADFDGLKVKVKYFGRREQNLDLPIFLGEFEKEVTADIRAGRWSRVDVRIPSVKPEDISRLSVEVTPDVLRLVK